MTEPTAFFLDSSRRLSMITSNQPLQLSVSDSLFLIQSCSHTEKVSVCALVPYYLPLFLLFLLLPISYAQHSHLSTESLSILRGIPPSSWCLTALASTNPPLFFAFVHHSFQYLSYSRYYNHLSFQISDLSVFRFQGQTLISLAKYTVLGFSQECLLNWSPRNDHCFKSICTF